MELVIALVLFIAIVAAWLFLPSTSAKAPSAHSADAVSSGAAGRTA